MKGDVKDNFLPPGDREHFFVVRDIQPLLGIATPPVLRHYSEYRMHVALGNPIAQEAAGI